MTHYHMLDQVTPKMVRLCARHPDGTAMQNREIAKACGKGIEWVAWVFKINNWNAMNHGDVRMYLAACNVHTLGETHRYWKRTFLTAQKPLAHLSGLPNSQARRLAKGVVR